MTPQEKAIEIFESMKGFRVKHSHAKKCAKNAATLVMSTHPLFTLERRYWEEVIEETKKIKTP